MFEGLKKFLILALVGVIIPVMFLTFFGKDRDFDIDVINTVISNGHAAWQKLMDRDFASLFDQWLKGASALLIFAVFGLPFYLGAKLFGNGTRN